MPRIPTSREIYEGLNNVETPDQRLKRRESLASRMQSLERRSIEGIRIDLENARRRFDGIKRLLGELYADRCLLKIASDVEREVTELSIVLEERKASEFRSVVRRAKWCPADVAT